MQAPLLLATAEPLATDPATVEAHAAESMRSLVRKRQDPALLLESLAGALQVSSTAAPEPAARSVRAAHLAVRALATVRTHAPAMHACRMPEALHLLPLLLVSPWLSTLRRSCGANGLCVPCFELQR